MITRQLLSYQQQEIMSKIDSFLNNDEQHISIVLGPGCGKTTMSMILAGELSSSYNVVYLSYYISTREYAKHYFDDNGINARAETIQRFTNETMHAVYTPHENDLWIIDEAQDVGISDLQKRLNISAWSVKTISFADPLQVVDDKGNMSEMMELDESWDFTSAFVQTTSQAIDIRLCYAEEPDKGRAIKDQIEGSLNDANDKLHKSIEEHDRIQDEIRVLLDRIQIVTDLEAENEALKKEKHELDEKLVNAEKQIKAIKQICQVQSAMLTYFGVSEDDVKEAANQIDTIRDLLQERLMSADAEIVESAYQELQDKAVEISVNIAKKTMKETNASSCTDRLSGLFTLPVWNRLSEKSRSFLVTADYTYENMIQQDSREEFDYSGVCLLVTKAVEVESCNRFFNEYKAYLVEKLGRNVDSWPDAMTKTDRFGGKYAARDFTLGSVVHITGYDKEMNDVSFLDYASSVLYPGKEAIWIKNQLKSACEFVEKVRKDYRNPASHKESIKMVTAAECLDYVINVQKKLKEMIVYMNH